MLGVLAKDSETQENLMLINVPGYTDLMTIEKAFGSRQQKNETRSYNCGGTKLKIKDNYDSHKNMAEN